MNQIEIRNKINENNKIIMNLFTPNQFILNNTVSKLLQENEKLQKLCHHEYEDGFCIYCDEVEPNND